MTYFPYVWAFEIHGIWLWLDHSLDYVDRAIFIFFVLDVVVGFLTSYYTQYNTIESSKKNVAIKYLKTWFVIDFLSALPFEYFLHDISSASKLMKLFKMQKLIRLSKIQKILKSIQEVFSSISISMCTVVTFP